MGSVKSFSAFREPKGSARDGEFLWTLMVKLLNVSKSGLMYEQFAKGKFTLYFNDGSSLDRWNKDVTYGMNPHRKSYGDWYEDMQKGESSGPKSLYSGDTRYICNKVGTNEIFYQWWDQPGVGLNFFEKYDKDKSGLFTGIAYDMEFSHKLWENSNLLYTVVVALKGEHHMKTIAGTRDTRTLIVKSAGRL